MGSVINKTYKKRDSALKRSSNLDRRLTYHKKQKNDLESEQKKLELLLPNLSATEMACNLQIVFLSNKKKLRKHIQQIANIENEKTDVNETIKSYDSQIEEFNKVCSSLENLIQQRQHQQQQQQAASHEEHMEIDDLEIQLIELI